MAEQQPRGGGGYDEPIPEPVQPEPGINPEEYIMPDQSETWDQVVTQANSAKPEALCRRVGRTQPQQGQPAGQPAGPGQ